MHSSSDSLQDEEVAAAGGTSSLATAQDARWTSWRPTCTHAPLSTYNGAHKHLQMCRSYKALFKLTPGQFRQAWANLLIHLFSAPEPVLQPAMAL